MKKYEKRPPAKHVTDEQRHRRVTYYHSDIEPYRLMGAVDLRYSDGEARLVHVEVTDGVLPEQERLVVEAANKQVWLAAVAQDKKETEEA